MGFYNPDDLTLAPGAGAERRLAFENGILFLMLNVGPRLEMRPHKHTWPTLYYVLSGTGRSMVGDEVRVLAPGTLVMIPAGAMHGVETTQGLEMIEVQPGAPRDFVDGLISGVGPR